MRSYLLQGILILTVLLAGCSSGKKAYERGDYYNSVIKSVNRLRSNPDHQRSVKILKQAYPLAIAWYKNNVNRTLSSNESLKWSKVVGYYEQMNAMNREIWRCPGALNVIPNPIQFDTELAHAKGQAGPECYQAGILALDEHTRDAAKQAYYHFLNADKFVPGYRDVKDKIFEAREAATLKVVLEQIPLPSQKYKISADFFQENVEAYITSFYKKEFVRFYTPEEAEVEKLEIPNQIIRLQFEDFVVGNTNHLRKEYEVVSADSVKVGDVKLQDGKIMPVYNKVKAKIKENRSELISKGLLGMQIVEFPSNKILLSDKIHGEFVWFTTWGSFNGDERALTKEQLEMVKREPVLPPAPQVLFVEFTKPIYDQLIQKIFAFYRGY